MIGADGGRSIVREQTGIGVRSWEHLREALTVVFHAPLWDVVGSHRYVIYGVEHPVPATFLPAGHGDRWVYGFDWDPTRERIDDYPPARLVDRIRTGAGQRDLDVRLGRSDRSRSPRPSPTSSAGGGCSSPAMPPTG